MIKLWRNRIEAEDEIFSWKLSIYNAEIILKRVTIPYNFKQNFSSVLIFILIDDKWFSIRNKLKYH